MNGLDSNLNLDAEVARYRKQALIAVQTAFMIGAIILWVLIDASWGIEASIIGSGAISALSIALARRQMARSAAVILCIQFLALPTYLTLTALGTFDAAMLIYPAGLIAIALVGKPRQTAIFSILTVGCTAVVGYATYKNWIGHPAFTQHIAKDPIDIVASVVIVGFAGVIATYVSTILTRVLRKLADHQATLEEQVERRTKDLANSNDELRQAVNRLDQARAELVRGEKLAGLGSLVAGVAHELNTPIGNTAVTASSLMHHVQAFRQLVESGNLRKSDMQAFLNYCAEGSELLVNTTQRAAELVASFKQVAVDQATDRRRVFNLGEVVNDVIRSMRPGFKGRDWQVRCEIPADISCDSYPGPLGQVITNLVQNAVFHGFHGRETGNIVITGTPIDADWVQITVRDDGLGIPADALQKIFDPFFTTRLGQGGSGLGLTIVHNLVTVMLSGRIAVESSPGHGTCFTISMPRTTTRVSAEPSY